MDEHTKKVPPLILIEPNSRQKRQHLAKTVFEGEVNFNQQEIKRRIKKIRRYSQENMSVLSHQFRRNVSQYKDAHVVFANDTTEAVDYINHVVQDIKVVAVGKSSTVDELLPVLEKGCYRLIDSYSSQFILPDGIQKNINYPWQFQSIFNRSAWDTFEYSRSTDQKNLSGHGLKDIVALLGVNAASADDGSLFLLQHSNNIGTMLRQARKLVFVVGLEKIVENSSDALFQTKCAGAFGMESILLDLKAGDTDQEKRVIDPLSEVPEVAASSQELHMVLLDNRRTNIAEGDYKELLQCIACRACSKQCPGYRYLKEFSRYPKDYLWSFLIGYNSSIELCSNCVMCEVECPVDINLSKLIAKTRAEYSTGITHFWRTRLISNVARFALIGSLIPSLFNWLSRRKMFRMLVERVAGIDRRRKVPAFNRETFEQWFRSRHV